MKNSRVVLGMLVLALAFVMVLAGCKNPTEDVGQYEVHHGPSVKADFTVEQRTSGGALVVNFTPVAGAASYTFYLSTDKKVLKSGGGSATIGTGIKVDGSTQTVDLTTKAPDYTLAYVVLTIATVDDLKYYVGIQANDDVGNNGKIVWSSTSVAAN